VDGVPNVMTCLRPTAGGEQIETQNVLGSRNADLLRLADWFFPKGIDHHHLMAGVPGLQDVMQSFAQKIAGLGRLPARTEAPRPARRAEVDAAVVGAGPAGVAVASRLAAAGFSVTLIDDGDAPCEALAGARATSPRYPNRAAEVLAEHPLTGAGTGAGAGGNVQVLQRHVAAGVYLGELLVAGDEGALVLCARATIFATGAHDGMVAVPNNDLPGVFSARALCRLLAHGLEPTGPVVLVGEGFWADELAARLGPALAARVPVSSLTEVRGSSEVRGAILEEGAPPRRRTVKAVAVALAAPGAPAFEVAAQAGAEARYAKGVGYAVHVDDRGRAAEGVWAVGECTGAPADVGAILESARIVAADVQAALAGR
ncbi:MAG TPA: FAD-dependent oxidoreductase, partial [Candidatus Nanopelagicales bacterium]|nr:FAD-dependent oxidoreductase [Candidatus Nanopelagicales bacterium]